jgi:hypothetical protein
MNKENIFDKIDSYFESRDKKEFYYVLAFIVLLIGFVIYYYIFPLAQDYKEKEENLNKDLKQEIAKLNTDISVLRSKIFALNKKISQLKSDLGKVKKEKIFYEELAKLLDFVNFNQYVWGQFVKGCVDDARRNGLEVVDIKNVLYTQQKEEPKKVKKLSRKKEVKKPQKQKFISKKLDVTLTLKGDYKNFIWYIYDYENRKELIRVSQMKILSPNSFSVTFSLYGKEQ